MVAVVYTRAPGALPGIERSSARSTSVCKNCPSTATSSTAWIKCACPKPKICARNWGRSIFPGWQQTGSGQILYNQSYVFLVGLADPACRMGARPQEIQRGARMAGSPADNELWEGRPYFLQSYTDGQSPEAFTVRVGDTYVGSMPGFDWMRVSLMQQFRRDLPAFIAPVFPYKLVVSLFLPNSDAYISLLEHENFHAYQATWVPDRFEQAEFANLEYAEDYPGNWRAASRPGKPTTNFTVCPESAEQG